MNDCNDNDKKKEGPAPRQQEKLCLVCGDVATGYHYNVLSCHGCKGFFRRSIAKDAEYRCIYGNGCQIDMYMRKKCQQCRLQKCLDVGMMPESVLPEHECAIRRETKKARKDVDEPDSDFDEEEQTHQEYEDEEEQPQQEYEDELNSDSDRRHARKIARKIAWRPRSDEEEEPQQQSEVLPPQIWKGTEEEHISWFVASLQEEEEQESSSEEDTSS